MLFLEEEIKNEDKGNRKALMPTEIISLFEWSLTLDYCPIIIETTTDLWQRLHRTYQAQKETDLSEKIGLKNTNKVDRLEMGNTYIQPSTEMEIKLTEIFEIFFGLEGIGVEDNFFELGGNSLKAMGLLKKIKKELYINLSLKVFFSKQNIKELAEEIEEIQAILDNNKTVKGKTTLRI